MRVGFCVVLALCLAHAVAAQTEPAFRFGGGPWQPLRLLAASDDGTVFATVGTDLYASTDSGLTWSLRSSPFAIRGFAPARGDTLWATASTGVYRSTDAGSTWALERSGNGGSLVVDGADVVAYVDGLWRRRSGLWSSIPLPPPGVGTSTGHLAARNGRLAIGRLSYGTLYTSSSALRSDDDGATWSAVSCGGYVNALALAADGTVWCTATASSTFYGDVWGGVYRAAPGGASEAISTDDAAGAEVLSDGSVVYAVGGDVFLDGALLASSRAPAVAQVIPVSAGRLLSTASTYRSGFDPPTFAASGSGVYLSTPTREVQVGIVPAAVYALATVGADTLLAGGTSGTVHRLDGDAWVNAGTNLALVRQILPATSTAGPLVLGAAAVEADGGGSPYVLPSVVRLTGEMDDLLGRFGEVAGVVSFGARSVIAAPRRSTYGGEEPGLLAFGSATWSFEMQVPGTDLRALYQADSLVGYAGAWGPLEYEGTAAAHRLYRTADGGATWAPDDAGVTADEVFAFVAHDGATLAGTDDGVIVRDGDGVWSADGLAGLTVRALAVVDSIVAAGTSDGFFRRADGAWTRYGTGLDGRTVYAILAAGTADAPWLAVGTDAGVYATRPLATIDAEPTPAPTSVALRVAPNPTRDRLTVEAGDSAAGAEAAVFDAFGRRVATVRLGADGTAAFDTRALAAGIYVVRVILPDEAARTARITVVR